MSEGNKALVLRLVERIWNGHDLDLAEELFAADLANGLGRPSGPSSVKEWHRSTRETFPDLRYSVEEVLAEGNRVALRWTATGTQSGWFGPIPPTGKAVTYAGVHFFTIEDGRIADLWAINDTFGKILQLGAELVPPEA